MSNNFNELFSQMLLAYKNGMSVDEIISNQIEKEGLGKEQADSVLEAAKYQGLLSDSYEDLQKAKADGDSREDWLNDRLDFRMIEFTDEQKASAIEAIQQTLLRNLEATDE